MIHDHCCGVNQHGNNRQSYLGVGQRQPRSRHKFVSLLDGTLQACMSMKIVSTPFGLSLGIEATTVALLAGGWCPKHLHAHD